ncbi:hypothetical protein D3C72_1644630 [compost metagenome]
MAALSVGFDFSRDDRLRRWLAALGENRFQHARIDVRVNHGMTVHFQQPNSIVVINHGVEREHGIPADAFIDATLQ